MRPRERELEQDDERAIERNQKSIGLRREVGLQERVAGEETRRRGAGGEADVVGEAKRGEGGDALLPRLPGR